MPSKSLSRRRLVNAKIIIERDGAVERIVFNRPDKKNALDREMYLTIIAALREAEADATLRAVLFAGAGGDFTAGNDLHDFREGPRRATGRMRQRIRPPKITQPFHIGYRQVGG